MSFTFIDKRLTSNISNFINRGIPPPAKKGRAGRAAPVAKIMANERVKQFPMELYEDSGIPSCHFCDHSLDFIRLDTIKDHFKSKKNKMRMDLKEAESSGVAGPVQVTLRTAIKSKDLREEFILNFIKMCTVADIPLEKPEKMRPFLRNTAIKVVLCHSHRVLGPGYRLFDQYYQFLKELLQSSRMPVYIISDETTDVRDKSVLMSWIA